MAASHGALETQQEIKIESHPYALPERMFLPTSTVDSRKWDYVFYRNTLPEKLRTACDRFFSYGGYTPGSHYHYNSYAGGITDCFYLIDDLGFAWSLATFETFSTDSLLIRNGMNILLSCAEQTEDPSHLGLLILEMVRNTPALLSTLAIEKNKKIIASNLALVNETLLVFFQCCVNSETFVSHAQEGWELIFANVNQFSKENAENLLQLILKIDNFHDGWSA